MRNRWPLRAGHVAYSRQSEDLCTHRTCRAYASVCPQDTPLHLGTSLFFELGEAEIILPAGVFQALTWVSQNLARAAFLQPRPDETLRRMDGIQRRYASVYVYIQLQVFFGLERRFQ